MSVEAWFITAACVMAFLASAPVIGRAAAHIYNESRQAKRQREWQRMLEEGRRTYIEGKCGAVQHSRSPARDS